jgi:hypothetical protein
MRTSAVCIALLFVAVPALVLACKKDDATNPANAPNGMASGGYGAPQGYGQPPSTYGQPGMQPTTQPMTPGTVPGAPGGSTLSVPGPAALPCSNDSMCMTHRCNMQYGKCAFPCASDADCIQGAYCFKSAISTCLPKPPGQ